MTKPQLLANSIMTIRSSLPVLSLFSYERLFRKPLLFKSFTGLTIEEFDNIYDKKVTKRYGKHELIRLSKRKYTKRERKFGAGRPFNLDTR